MRLPFINYLSGLIRSKRVPSDRAGYLIYLKPGDRYQFHDVLEYDGCARVVGTPSCHFRPGDTVTTYDVRLARPRRYIAG